MCLFSYILGGRSEFCKNVISCFSQYLGSLVWQETIQLEGEEAKAFMLVGIYSHKFTGLFQVSMEKTCSFYAFGEL